MKVISKKQIRLLSIFLLLLLLMLTTAGCKVSENKSASLTEKKNFNVVTSFYPMYVFAQNVIGDTPGVSITNMTEPQTGCLHDYQLTTKDMKALEGAQVFIINGAGMEAFMEKVIQQRPNLKVIEAASGISLLKDASTGEANPHVWVSISHAITEVNNISKGLAKADPQHAEQYKKNAAIYIAKLEAQKVRMHQALDPLKHRDIVTFHEAFPYFAQEFQLNIVTVIEREPGSEPGPKELGETIDKIKASSVKALFVEPQYSPKAAQLISKETGKMIYTLDPATTGKLTPDPDAYIRIMDDNLAALKKALE